ncbi:MAG: leucine--tRNA ligase [Candidatus Micrarchaeota archaeon]|nr:leucine--tRNA ligase [Candidatus Micrarchaeota archaeon]
MEFAEMARKWQERWANSRLFESEPDSREKFYITAAFPYPNSPQHIGHARTYTITDVCARYMRMRGKNVLFPMGFHVTGTPIMAMAKRIEEKDPELMGIFTNVYGMDRAFAESLTNPKDLVMAFSKEIERGMHEMGFSIDWRRKFYTFDKEFNSFITWQFHKLKEAGLIKKGKHPVPYCPRCGNAVGGHDTKGDVDPELGEFVTLKFVMGDASLLAATLRPETVYGVTNVWVNADADYAKASIDGEVCIVSKEALQKFKLQDHKVDEIECFKGSALAGKKCRVPIVGTEVPIMTAPFVDPANATGVVMSVPAHAPYDYVALVVAVGKEQADKMLISIIETGDKELGNIPAKAIVEKMGIKSLDDQKLEEATKVVYRKELHYGVMKVGELKGTRVEKARDYVRDELINNGEGGIINEIINRPVKCRCGGTVEVKVFEDQWFINYSDEGWKEKARECLSAMSVVPPARKSDFEYAINWLHEKACTRATGLGTRFPFDESKMIEALSDSTVYMAFYTVKHLLKRPLSVSEWDYVILGKGSASPELVALRESFEYWYPLDARHSGADLVYNHLPFFIFNHTAIFPKDKWPKGIVVNGFVLMDGQKMSKSLGNILPLRKAVAQYGPDPVRVAVISGAELGEDTDFNKATVEGITGRLRFMLEMCNSLSERAGNNAEKWLEMRLAEYGRRALAEHYPNLNYREIVNDLLYRFANDIKWCIKRGGKPTRGAIERWVLLMAPITPHLCDEMWERLGGSGFATTQMLDDKLFDEEADAELEECERIIENTVNDIKEIKKLIGKESGKATIIVADEFKRRVFRSVGDTKIPNEAIKNAMADEEIRARGKEAMGIIKSAMKWKSGVVLSEAKEHDALVEAAAFISEEVGLKVVVMHEGEAGGVMKEKAAKSLPGKPSIYIE